MFHSKLVYDKNAVCQSRVCDDYERTVNIDENGDERITFEKVDYPKLQESLGSVDVWSLKSLLAAGIDPEFGIRTGFGTQLDAEVAIKSAIGKIDNVVASSKNE